MRFTGPDIPARSRSPWHWTGTALFLLVSLWFSPAEGAYRVTDISFASSPGEIRVNIRTDAPVVYDYFKMEETQPQVVFDLTDAVHDLERYRFQPPVTDLVQRVRTSQYRPYPRPVVRIVLDLQDMVPFEVSTVDRGLVVRVTAPQTIAEPVAEHAPIRTAEQMKNEKPVSAPDRPAVSEPSPADPSATQLSAAAPSSMPEPTPETSSHPESSTPESVRMESTVTEMVDVQPDTAAAGHEPGSLMARLLALGIRQPVSYLGGGRRDPFVPLPAQQDVEFGQAPLPDVEKLSIVGILQGIDGYRALAQDDEDNGYVLRRGDRVLYGYVARIEAERVIFYLNRRGLDRTVILKIPQ